MLDWKIFAVITPLFFVTYQALSKLLPKDTSIFLVNAYASCIGFFVMLLLHFLISSNKSVMLSPKSLSLAVVIGVLVSLGNYGIIKAYSLGAPQSLFTPLFYVSLILYGIVIGLLFWHEKLNGIQFFGILLSVIGILITVYFKK